MPGNVLILEDDAERTARFSEALHKIDATLRVVLWRSAKTMLLEMDAHLADARLISLDHDLYPAFDETNDPGDGLEVAKALAPVKPSCPILIHSSNADRARMMLGEFELEGCTARTVAPLGADWIENYWAVIVRSLLINKA